MPSRKKAPIVRESTLLTVKEEITELGETVTRLKMRCRVLSTDSDSDFYEGQLKILTEKIKSLRDQKKMLILAYENRGETLAATRRALSKACKRLNVLKNLKKIEKLKALQDRIAKS